ncbi:indole-3-glycerol phosphate synthase TrpC [Thermoplasma sp.]|uniref:indole-3-glycerol phosphate synthase TrpC n=1 Tax=Thermoplasma sp. TaxID=1973142 RepID=UPI001278FA37|nr:indole-3-glycerol phosphate synthase TrpC [Thermoplasma sp.]KAA8921974.1 MAG: indole-3-glycerol phosphate synthase TrpC [Thermoplasma sp.]
MNIDEVLARNRKRHCDYRRSRGTISLRKAIEKRNEEGRKGLIAEYKRRSPSGFSTDEDIHSYLSYVRMHRITGLSILSEPVHFSGSFDDVTVAHRLGFPVLVKDFTPDAEFVESAYNAGGDVVLAILDFLPSDEIRRIVRRSADLGMDVIEEYHNRDAISRFVDGDNVILGFNRRDLVSLKTEETHDPPFYDVAILESGINIDNVMDLDMRYSGYLVGTSILKRDGTLEYLEKAQII